MQIIKDCFYSIVILLRWKIINFTLSLSKVEGLVIDQSIESARDNSGPQSYVTLKKYRNYEHKLS